MSSYLPEKTNESLYATWRAGSDEIFFTRLGKQ